MILFFDLDGPLLDVSHRYAVLHHEILHGHGFEGMEKDRYWSAKRARRSEASILADLGADACAADYNTTRLSKIETADYLSHDRCWPWAIPCLQHLADHATLVMVTARAVRSALLDQLDRLTLRSHFHEILSEPGNHRVDLQKATLIKDYLNRHGLPSAGHWMIGDTEADIGAGKHLGLGTIAVLSGIRDEERLLIANPDFLVADVRDVPAILKLPPLPGEKSG